MDEREKVIKGLECCTKRRFGCDVIRDCPYISWYDHGHCVERMMTDAIALLKAQEPRVMTLEEVKKLRKGDDVYVERRCHIFPNMLYAQTVAESEPETEVIFWTDRLLLKDYMFAWRCWTSKPDEKRRAETPWE